MADVSTHRDPLLVPCLWFDDQAEPAAEFYTRTFPGGQVSATSRYPQSLPNPSGKPPGSVLTVEFEVAGQPFTALNGGPVFTINPSISFFVHVATPDEADRLFAALAVDGDVLMPLDTYPWSPRYGWVKDRFDVSWQIMCQQACATIAPCLMFTGPRHGQAQAALRHYAGILPGAKIQALERYAPGEGPTEALKHGRLEVAGQLLTAMDSHLDHQFTFNEGVSLQVLCSDQAEIDRYWSAFSEGGQTGQCGWLKDRFGVSWQLVPRAIADWMASEDPAARDRAFAAVMGMTKPDIAEIRAAFEGR